MKNLPRNKDAEGFSLIELLIASVVVAAAGALLIGGLVAANRSAEVRIDQTLATQLLASQLALLGDQLDPNTPTSGTFPPPLDEFAWTLEWTEVPLTPLAEATITVTTKNHVAHVVTYRPLVQP